MSVRIARFTGFLGGFGMGAAAVWIALWMGQSPSSNGPGASSTWGPAAERLPIVGGPKGPPPDWNAALGSVPAFLDIVERTGIAFVHENDRTGKFHYPEVMGGGVALLDADGDGYLDIYFVQGNRLLSAPSPDLTDTLYRNNADGTFTDITRQAGLGDATYGQGVCVGDHDNDGDPDIYLSNFGPNVLYRNDGRGSFSDVTAEAGVGDPGWGQSSSFLDFDGDGWLDLYVQNYLTYSLSLSFEAFIWIGDRKVLDYPSPKAFPGAADRLFRNNRNGTFTDVTVAAGVQRPDGKGMGCACFDVDDDGRVDLFVSNDSMENFLFHNRGDGTFEEIGLTAGVAFDGTGIAEASMGVDVGDHDGDGRMDVIIPCVWGQVFTLYRNEGSFFTDVSARAGLAEPTSALTGFSPSFIDYDNDGDQDLFFANGGVRIEHLASMDGSYEERYGVRDLLLANDGTGRYTDVSRLAGPHFSERSVSRGSVVGDLDNDGDLDIVVTHLGDRPAILRNETDTGNHWVSLKLVGRKGNRDALGTSVWCEAGGKRRRAVVHGGVTYLSQNDRRVHFGLGAADRVDRLEIAWPGGSKQTIEGLAADRRYTILEGEEPSR